MTADAFDEKLIEMSQRIDIDAVRALLSFGANPRYQSEWGNTALLALVTTSAREGGCVFEIAKILIEAGADVKAVDDCGNKVFVNLSVLHIPTIDLFLKAGADINTRNSNGTLLHVAAMAMNNDLADMTEVINYLVEKGIDETLRDVDSDTAIDAINKGTCQDKTKEVIDVIEGALERRNIKIRHAEIEKDHQETLQVIKSPAIKFRLRKP